MAYMVCKIYNKNTNKLLGFTEFNKNAECFGLPIFRKMKDLKNYWKRKSKESNLYEERFTELDVIIKSHYGQIPAVIKWNNVQGKIVSPMYVNRWCQLK